MKIIKAVVQFFRRAVRKRVKSVPYWQYMKIHRGIKKSRSEAFVYAFNRLFGRPPEKLIKVVK